MTVRYIPRVFGGVIVIPSHSPPIIGNSYSYHPPAYQGTGGMEPVYSLNTGYIINGQSIDTPFIRTAPMMINTGFILPGSTFILSFFNPSVSTQAALVDGSIVTISFALTRGTIATGPVKLSVVHTSLWIVTCTVQSTIIVKYT